MTVSISNLDILLAEFWSFDLYKRGKRPIGDMDPKERIRHGIWLDNGIDLTILQKRTSIDIEGIPLKSLFNTEEMEAREGFFRKKVTHKLLTGIKDLKKILDLIDVSGAKSSPGGSKIKEVLLGSFILYPLFVFHGSGNLDDITSEMKVKRRKQIRTDDLDPDSFLKNKRKIIDRNMAGEDLLGLYRKRIDKEKRFRTPEGRRSSNLKAVLEFLFTARDEDLRTVISSGSLMKFASEGLSSNVLEALFRDLSEDVAGGMEEPENYRIRLGRWMMEGPLGDDISRDLIPLLVNRLETCPIGESGGLEKAISSLMDPRSTSILNERVFTVEPEKRPYFIRLLGMTGDRAAVEPLERLMEFSSIEEDRVSARTALRSLGIQKE